MHSVSSSFDSRAALTQCLGGCRYRSHSLHQSSVTCFWMPSVMSTWDRMQLTHMLEGFDVIATPHRQHNLDAKQTRECNSWQ